MYRTGRKKKRNMKIRTYPLTFSNNEMLLSVLSVLLAMGIAQVVATFLGVGYVMMGLPTAIGQIITSVMYVAITWFGLRLICRSYLHISMADVRIQSRGLRPFWIAPAVVMPLLVTTVLLFMPGQWEVNRLGIGDTVSVLIAAVCYYGIAAAVVEELVFRGVILSAVEYRFGKRTAVVAPALFFAILQAGNCQSMVEVIQVVAAKTVMGVLLSLIVYQSGTVWNAVVVHGVWNLVMHGGILSIGTEAQETSLFCYVLSAKSTLLTGGSYGVEASLDAFIVYLLFAVFLFWLWRKNGTEE